MASREASSHPTPQFSHVGVMSFFEDTLGDTCAYLRAPNGKVTTQAWIVGVRTLDKQPRIMSEFSVLRALLSVRDFLRGGSTVPTHVWVFAEDRTTDSRLRERLAQGTLLLASGAVSRLVDPFTQLAATSPCPLLANWSDSDKRYRSRVSTRSVMRLRS